MVSGRGWPKLAPVRRVGGGLIFRGLDRGIGRAAISLLTPGSGFSGTWATMAYAAGLGIPVFFIGFADFSYPWGSLHSRLNDCQSVYVAQCQPTQCELL